MRICSDESAVAGILASKPSKRLQALGSVMADTHIELLPKSPLVVWCEGGEIDPQWRRSYPSLPGSLYETLENLRELSISEPLTTFDTPLHELRHLRGALERHMLL